VERGAKVRGDQSHLLHDAGGRELSRTRRIGRTEDRAELNSQPPFMGIPANYLSVPPGMSHDSPRTSRALRARAVGIITRLVHLRAQAVGGGGGGGFHGTAIYLRKIPGVVPKTVTECCGHDGNVSRRKVEGFEMSQRIGKEKLSHGMESSAESKVGRTVSCPLELPFNSKHGGA
jgi:hypothetical protein